MITPFDILGFDMSNEVLWIQAAADLGIAKARVAALMQAKPCGIWIFSQRQQSRFPFNSDRWQSSEV